MTNTIDSRQDNNVYEYPRHQFEPKQSITLGDVHGNVIKLLHFLISYSIVDFNEDPQQHYAEMVRLYEEMGQIDVAELRDRQRVISQIKGYANKSGSISEQEQAELASLNSQLTELDEELQEQTEKMSKNIAEFNSLLAKLSVKNAGVLVHLIGDEMADRGSNDYYTLKMLRFLRENQVELSIKLSNHSNEFILFYEQLANPEAAAQNPFVNPRQVPSVIRLQHLIECQLVSEQEFSELVDVYKPCLKVLDYHLDEKGITLFSHAPIAYAAIPQMANNSGVVFDDSSKEALALSIDKINHKVAELVKENRLFEMFGSMEINADNRYQVLAKYPLSYIAWTRWDNTQEEKALRPNTINGYQVQFVHGHDKFISDKSHINNLDTVSGKMTASSIQKTKQRIEATLESINEELSAFKFKEGADVAAILKKISELDKQCKQKVQRYVIEHDGQLPYDVKEKIEEKYLKQVMSLPGLRVDASEEQAFNRQKERSFLADLAAGLEQQQEQLATKFLTSTGYQLNPKLSVTAIDSEFVGKIILNQAVQTIGHLEEQMQSKSRTFSSFFNSNANKPLQDAINFITVSLKQQLLEHANTATWVGLANMAINGTGLYSKPNQFDAYCLLMNAVGRAKTEHDFQQALIQLESFWCYEDLSG